MANTITSANMSLPIPVVGTQTGPDYALNVDACFQIIDAHDHTSGNGVAITPDALNINAELPLNENNLTGAKTVRFVAQSSVDPITPNLGCLYVVGDDLYYNDEAGNAIRITQNGAVTGAAGTITGLPSGTASASYSAGPAKFIFQSASNVGADLDFASAIIREKVANGKGVTLSAPTALAADYNLILPAALPASQKFATIDNSGNIAAVWSVDNSTLEISSNLVQVKDAGITSNKLAAQTISVSSSCGAFSTSSAVSEADVTNLSLSWTASGTKKVVVEVIPDGTDNPSNIFYQQDSEQAGMYIKLKRGTGGPLTTVGRADLESVFSFSGGYNHQSLTPYLKFIDTPSAGTYTYKITVENKYSGSSQLCGMNYVKMIITEF